VLDQRQRQVALGRLDAGGALGVLVADDQPLIRGGLAPRDVAYERGLVVPGGSLDVV
jgi:hypothetical protein